MNPKATPPIPDASRVRLLSSPAVAFGHAQVAHDVGQHQGVEHGVESIEHPAQGGSQERAALIRGDLGEREAEARWHRTDC